MTQPGSQTFPVTMQKAWAQLTKNMGQVNLSRVRQARKAANELARMKART